MPDTPSTHSIKDDFAAVREGIDPGHPTVFFDAVDRIEEQLEAAEEYADEGWAWVGAALHALGVSHVFEIPEWRENLRKSIEQRKAEKEVAAAQYPAKQPEERAAASSPAKSLCDMTHPGEPCPATGYRDEDSGVWIDKPGPHARRPSNPATSSEDRP